MPDRRGDDECNYIGRRERAHNAEHLLRKAVSGAGYERP